VANLAIEEAPESTKIIAVSVQIPHADSIQSLEKKQTFFSLASSFSNTYLVLRRAVDIMIMRNEAVSLSTRKNVHFLQLGHGEIEYYDFRAVDTLVEAGYALGEGIERYLSHTAGSQLDKIMKKICYFFRPE